MDLRPRSGQEIYFLPVNMFIVGGIQQRLSDRMRMQSRDCDLLKQRAYSCTQGYSRSYRKIVRFQIVSSKLAVAVMLKPMCKAYKRGCR